MYRLIILILVRFYACTGKNGNRCCSWISSRLLTAQSNPMLVDSLRA